jgi:hypothetical protein
MTEHGQALAMQLALTRLQKRHEVPTDLFVIPLSEAVDHDLVVEGFASTTDIDFARNCFSKHAFTIPEQPVPLLYKHDPTEIAGTIQSLSCDRNGKDSCHRHP